MWSSVFWVDAAERAISTFAQALLGCLVVGAPIWQLDWQGSLGIAATATVLSLLKSIAATTRGDSDSASLALPESGKHAV